MHERLGKLPGRFSEDLEVAYIDEAAMRRFLPGEEHATITSHGPFRWERHDANWLLDRWMTREHGFAWYGPEPASLIDPISDEEVRAATLERTREWGRWADTMSEKDRLWFSERAHQCYVIETMCRALHALAHPGLPTKPQAVTWALSALPDPWRKLVERSREWRMQQDLDDETAQEALAFVRWAAENAQ
jgi:hypothetical protein